jgi:hypothetical protein
VHWGTIWNTNLRPFINFYSNLTQCTGDHKTHTNSRPFKKHNVKPTIPTVLELASMSGDLSESLTQLHLTFWKLEDLKIWSPDPNSLHIVPNNIHTRTWQKMPKATTDKNTQNTVHWGPYIKLGTLCFAHKTKVIYIKITLPNNQPQHKRYI